MSKTMHLLGAIGSRASRLLGLTLVGVLLGSVAAHPVRACTLAMDGFTYANGSNLHGQSGGSDGAGAFFTSGWQASGATPTSAFGIENGQVMIGDTGGNDYRISRGMDLSGAQHPGCAPSDPGCNSSPISNPGTSFFAGQMAQIIDNHAAYEIAVEFSDTFGITAAFGIEHDGIGADDYFFAELGTSRIVSSVAAAPDTPYYLYGVVDYDIAGGSDERLRFWINPAFSDVLDGINADIDMTFDLESISGGTARSDLGDTMSLFANTNQAGVFKSFDDVQIARDIGLLSVPRLDIGNGTLQVAFEEWAVGTTPQPNFSINFDQQTYEPSISSRIVSLTVDAVDGGLNVSPVEDTLSAGYADSLRADRVEAAGGVRLTFSNLLEDQYYVKTFHYQTSDNDPVDVYLSEDDGISFTFYGNFTPAGGTDAATEFMIFFETLAGLDIVVEFRPTVAGNIVGLSGLQFVPEPGTGLLLGLGLAGLALRRRRQTA
jgi:hypothetical protein